MVLKLYYCLLSPPSRALFITLRISNIPFDGIRINLGEDENLTKEFIETKSKFQKVPIIHDGDFRLTESVAIIRYISREYSLPDYWYPRNSKEQARIDEFLEWNHLNLRLHSVNYFVPKFFIPLKKGIELSEEKEKVLRANFEKSLQDFEKLFLDNNSRFMFGDKITFADLQAACEIEQNRMVGYDARDYFPKIRKWIKNVRAECNPTYDKVHKYVNKINAALELDYTFEAKL